MEEVKASIENIINTKLNLKTAIKAYQDGYSYVNTLRRNDSLRYSYDIEIYNNATKIIKSYVEKLKRVSKFAEITSSKELLNSFIEAWKEYEKRCNLLSFIYKCLNEVSEYREVNWYKKHNFNCEAKQIWKNAFKEIITKQLPAAILKVIKEEREHVKEDFNNKAVLHHAMILLQNSDKEECKHMDGDIELNDTTWQAYSEVFEKNLLEEARAYYKAVYKKHFATYSRAQYFELCSKHLRREEMNIMPLTDVKAANAAYILHSTGPKLLNTALSGLIDDQETLIAVTFKDCLNNGSTETLKHLYDITICVSDLNLSTLVNIFEDWTTRMVNEAIDNVLKTSTSKELAKQFVETIIKMHSSWEGIIAESFPINEFKNAVEKSLEKCTNTNAITAKYSYKRPAQLLVKYCDDMLKKWAKMRSDVEITDALKGIEKVFKLLEEKDTFEVLYSQYYVRRLINLSAPIDVEECELVARFKAHCGASYTRRFETLHKDSVISKELNAEAKSTESAESTNAVFNNFSTLVMQSNCWPLTLTEPPSKLPNELMNYIQYFHQFYEGKHAGRKLQWMHSVSRGELKYRVNEQQLYILQMSTYQMCIMLLYNNKTSYTRNELITLTGLPEETLIGNLQTLIDCSLLQSVDDDVCVVFELNLDFHSSKRYITLAQRSLAVKKQETEKLQRNINDGRKLLIEAAIVRIMKAHKTLHLNDIIIKVVEALSKHFPVDIPVVKTVIIRLTEREYIELDEDATDVYKYLA